MTQTTEQHLDSPSANTVTLEANVHFLPPIEMPWTEGTQEFPQSAAYDGYLAAFLSRMETLMVYGCPGVQFGKLRYVDLNEGYLRLEVSVRIDVTESEPETLAQVLVWEASYPDNEDEPSGEHQESGERLSVSLVKLLEERIKDIGHPAKVRLDELYGRANPHYVW